MRILVADDSQPIRQRLVERLSGLPGVCVAEAENTTDALQQIEIFAPDVAVLDIRMPGGGGIKVLGEIKTKHPSVIVMIVTSYPYAQYRRKCLEAGADFFFDKSTEFEQVAEIVRQLGQNGNPGEVAHRTAFAQLVDAKERMERIEQRQRDLNILGSLQKPANAEGVGSACDSAYSMWEKTFDTLLDLVAIFDADQRIVRVNKALADRMGVPPAELVGKKCYECFHGRSCPVIDCPHEVMLKDNRENFSEIYDECMGGWFEIRVSPIHEEGRLIGVIHFARDVTSRKQAEMQARTTLDSLSANIAIVDENGVILSVNRSWEKFAEVNHLVCGIGPELNYLTVCDGVRGSGRDDAVRFAEGLRSVLRGDCEFYEMEYSCVVETGELWFCG
ncbi:MAG: response regulator, partial [Pontiellaceae bacterium]|nr:response regulator [Pontiellaceae bacterium]